VTVIYSFRVSGDVLVGLRGLQLFVLKWPGTFSGLNAVLCAAQRETHRFPPDVKDSAIWPPKFEA
jgi:hypothetical protein